MRMSLEVHAIARVGFQEGVRIMSLWNRNVIAAIAVSLSIGAASGIGRPMSQVASAEMQGFQSRPVTRSSSGRLPALVASSQDDDWTAWGGAYRGSPALSHK